MNTCAIVRKLTQYDYAGQDRVSKMVRTGTAIAPIYERTIYIDGVFEYIKLEDPSDTYEKNYIHMMDDKNRIAEVRINVGHVFPGDIGDDVVYIVENLIGSSVMRTDTSGDEIDREEYYPFGDSSLRTFTYKRYRYVGKERDQESGLYYYGARYYAAWTCRFISVDPLAADYPQLTPYNYANQNPINDFDIDGQQDTQTESPTQNNSQNTPYGPQSQLPNTKPSLPEINGVVGPWSNEAVEKNSPHVQLDEVVVKAYPDFAYPVDDIDEKIAREGIDNFAPKLHLPEGITGGMQKEFAEWNYSNAMKNWNGLSLEDKWMEARKQIGFGALHEVAKKSMQPALEAYTMYAEMGGFGSPTGVVSKATNLMKTEAKIISSSAEVEAGASKVATEIETTAHGSERIAGPSATRGGVLTEAEVKIAKELGKKGTQGNGGFVYLQEVNPGRFNAVLENAEGKLITTMKNFSQKSINKLARNYGWKF